MVSSSPTAISGSVWSRLRGASASAIALFAAGCGTATIDEAIPGASRSGVYPNLNIPQQAATEQLTDEQAAAGAAAVSAARAGQQAAGSDPSASDAERLHRLRETHGETALGDIEG